MNMLLHMSKIVSRGQELGARVSADPAQDLELQRQFLVAGVVFDEEDSLVHGAAYEARDGNVK